MKKLALALVCLVSVAFFASCNQEILNPEPSIAIMTGDNYVYDGQTIDLNTSYLVGFRAASNSQTLKELSQFKLACTITDLEENETESFDTTFTVSGTEYIFTDTIAFYAEAKELVGKVTITATIADVNGKLNSVTINLNVNQPAVALEPADFTWYRHGSNAAEGNLADLGLKWSGNSKESFVILVPVDGATLLGFDPAVWDEVTTDVEKTSLFTEGLSASMSDFRGVSAWSSQDYDFVIGTIYNGEYHLIHITHADVESKTDVTITGQFK